MNVINIVSALCTISRLDVQTSVSDPEGHSIGSSRSKEHAAQYIKCTKVSAKHSLMTTNAAAEGCCPADLLLHPFADGQLILPLHIALALHNGWQQANSKSDLLGPRQHLVVPVANEETVRAMRKQRRHAEPSTQKRVNDSLV